MDIAKLGKKAMGAVRQYRYPILVLVIGLVLMWLPKLGGGETEQPMPATQTAEKTDLSAELSRILSQMEGVGRVQVMLTVAAGETTVYQTDEDTGGTSIRKDTVIVTDSQRNQSALITQVNPVRYRGAIIVCQGADSPAVRLAIVEAVSRATGLGADNISVLKMK